jgi:hypothetical protein
VSANGGRTETLLLDESALRRHRISSLLVVRQRSTSEPWRETGGIARPGARAAASRSEFGVARRHWTVACGPVRLSFQACEEVTMAEAGLFVGWGAPVRGREAKGLEVFNESVAYWGRLEEDGRIESFEVVLLYPHGGDLAGFSLLRGTHDQLNDVGGDEEFLRLTARGGLVVERLGIVRAALGEGLERQISIYQQAIGELT